nr:claudin-11-like [Nerophis lumbriciformis]
MAETPARGCRSACGTLWSLAGWLCVVVATATNDWVRTCDYGALACVRMDELGARGLWADCVVGPALYRCAALDHVVDLPAHVLGSRALMLCACLLGLPALLLALSSAPCVRLPHDSPVNRKRRALVGGVLLLLTATSGLVSTVWFPVGVHRREGIVSFGPSLYSGWAGVALCFLGGVAVLCGRGEGYPPGAFGRESFLYSRRRAAGEEVVTAEPPPANYAKRANV